MSDQVQVPFLAVRRFMREQRLAHLHLPDGWIDGRPYDSLFQLDDCTGTSDTLALAFDGPTLLDFSGATRVTIASASVEFAGHPVLVLDRFTEMDLRQGGEELGEPTRLSRYMEGRVVLVGQSTLA